MAHIDVELPRTINYGAVGGVLFSTEIVTVNSGEEQRNGLWENGKVNLTIDYLKDVASKDALIKFFRSMKGALHSFNMRDWSDFEVSPLNGVFFGSQGYLGIDGGVTSTLYKSYITSTEAEYRKINKPESGSIKLYKNAVEQTSGFSIDYTTGVVTWTPTSTKASSASVGATTTITCTAHGFSSGKIVSFSGYGGTLGTALNDKPFTITVTGLDTFTIALNTTGLTGVHRNVVTYPVSGETWTWEGTFFVPVRFSTDSIETTILDYGYEINELKLVEVTL